MSSTAYEYAHRPTALSTGARRRHNGASVSRTLTEYSRATPHDLGVDTARLRGCSQRMLRAHVELDRSAAWTRLGVRLAQDRQTRGRLSLARSLACSLSLSLPGLSGMVHVSDIHHCTKSGQPPLECSVCSHELPMYVRGHMRMGVCGYACACARA